MKRTLFSLCVLMTLYTLAVHAQWEPRVSPILTEWGEKLDPTSILPEYPRPQLVRENWTNLNGFWELAITDSADSQPEVFTDRILVPFCVESTLSGVTRKITRENAMWYQRQVDLEKPGKDQRVLLHFGAVDWICDLWVNGKSAGHHQGGYDAFWFDITDHLKRSGEQSLVLRVWDPTNEGVQPRGKQLIEPRGIWYTPVSGIWQTVWMEVVPSSFIQAIEHSPDVDGGRVILQAGVAHEREDQTLQYQIFAENQLIAEGEGRPGMPTELAIPDPHLWSPSDPFLYDLEVRLVEDGEVLDKVDSYLGMRKVEIRRDAYGVNRIFLNNRQCFNYGPLDQGWWPDGLYTAPADEALRYDVQVTKALGCNTARKHTKIEPARWYYWCDREGLLVWQDMPRCAGNVRPNAKEDGMVSAYQEKIFRTEYQAMIRNFRHFPSIICWIPFNEGWGQFKSREILDWTRELDSTRLAGNPSGWQDFGGGDWNDHHVYPGPGIPPLEEERAVVLGEFGGLKYAVPGHLWTNEGTWGYRETTSIEDLNQGYADLLHALYPLVSKGLAAAIYTQTSDVEIEVNGMMTYDRKVIKLDTTRARLLADKLQEVKPYFYPLPSLEQGSKEAWRYRISKPDEDWKESTYDDSGWLPGSGGFGDLGWYRQMEAGTRWDTSRIWIRRQFDLEKIPEGELYLNILSQNTISTVFLNGAKIAVIQPTEDRHQMIELDRSLKENLKEGTNTMAIFGYAKEPPTDRRSGRKRQFLDAGIIEVRD